MSNNFIFILVTLTFWNACLALVDRVNIPIANFNAQTQGLPDIIGLGPVRYPSQGQCNVMNVDPTDIVPGDWILVKATAISFPPPPGYDPAQINSCSAVCYTPDVCGGVRILIQDNSDNTMTFNTYSSNNLLRNIAHFETAVIKDPLQAIYQGHLIVMEILSDVEGGEFDDVDNVPPIITETQNVPFVKIAHSDAGTWMAFSTCGPNPRIWVLLANDVAHDQDLYNKCKSEYEQALSFVSGVDSNSLVDIPLADYFSV